jgi:serine/threonine-protein kinase
VYGFGEAAAPRPVPFVVMELVDGLPLSELLAQGALHWRTAVQIGAEVASALAAAHARGILHGNLSPGNVMVTPAGVKVVDFGISASAFVSADGGPAGPVVQADGGAASDVQALGELLYASLTGRTPTAEAGAEVCAASLAVPGLPPATAELCLRCLAAEPADRPFAATVAERLTAPRGTADGSLVGPRNRHPNAAGPHAGAPARLGNRGRS